MSEQSERLAELVDLSLDRARDILKVKLRPYQKNYLKLLTIQKETLAAVLSTQARVDEKRLRGRTKDKLGDILEAVKEAEAVKGRMN